MAGFVRQVDAEIVEIQLAHVLPSSLVREDEHGVVAIDVLKGGLEPLLTSLGMRPASRQ
jgi:hypothetical protein